MRRPITNWPRKNSSPVVGPTTSASFGHSPQNPKRIEKFLVTDSKVLCDCGKKIFVLDKATGAVSLTIAVPEGGRVPVTNFLSAPGEPVVRHEHLLEKRPPRNGSAASGSRICPIPESKSSSIHSVRIR